LSEEDLAFLEEVKEKFGFVSLSDSVRFIIRLFKIGIATDLIDVNTLGKVVGCIIATKGDDVLDQLRGRLSHKDLKAEEPE